ncbi:MAG: xanthine dehydrogenase family protein molybdopterin-binding subunit [Pseudomonadales bacterium]|nr:xanthine dehydrogenase family protein molybdopterin-binding subunit [Pseudomonadales bacterium]MBO6594739.1 xanthine dehydrogenase family protein molybdopterin-binding subunit [Pseudomonadales bacterium]MBO6701245.1 xanthine dehydrogenase family protein molybdopterin-binding subunit [Pseudomonadales bacterium]MBO6821701.1 xanthine dehydrogenase family protein molybdopterin-binding subunit [Pseudomonadales bacterium]MBO7007106.1 xanthine dehydrogenase family protein molybdopterin-binding subu
MSDFSRRDFLKVATSTAGGLMVGFPLLSMGVSKPYEAKQITAREINAWLVIEPDETVLIRIAKAEMGQGVMTSLPMFIADELEADWRKIKVEYADVNRSALRGQLYGDMTTRLSNSVSESRLMMHAAGAEARERLIKAAAETWGVRPEDCYADYGRVYQNSGAQSLGYGEVARLASEVSVANVKIKTPEFYSTLGLATPRLDVPAKVDGSAVFGIDVRVPDMVYATVLHNPVPGAGLQSMRFNAIRHMPGVIRALRLGDAIAIVAETFWQAKRAADMLPVYWKSNEGNKRFDDTIKREFFEKLPSPGEVMMRKGDINQLMDDAERSIESDYYVPYVAQAPLEPLNCTVHVQEERVDVWVGHQDPEGVMDVVAQLTGVSRYKVFVHNCFMGGSFGRRSHMDFVIEATRIAIQIGRPVQMIWTREEDMRAGGYRPMSAMRFKAGFDVEKNLTVITNHSVTHSIEYDQDKNATGVDEASVEGLVDHPYRFPAYSFSHSRLNTHLKSWWWRSGGHSINAFAMECFIDELAAAAEQDPLDYRKFLLRDEPDYLRVLDQLERKSLYRKRRPRRNTDVGMAIHKSYGTLVAVVAEVTVESNGGMRVDKLTAAVDCGNVANPMTAEEQVEGSLLFGLSATLYGKLTVEAGRILEDNLDTYEILRMEETPEVEIHWELSGGEHWGGLGEPATAVVAPAVCNALYKITGRRIRSLPVRDYYLTVK